MEVREKERVIFMTDIDCGHGCSHGLSEDSCISRVPIFNHLEEEKMQEIAGLIESLSFQKGELVYQAGEPSNALYIISQGRVKIYRLSEQGKEQLLRILHPGDFTGELALFSEKVHDSYAEVLENTRICTIHREDLQRLLLKYPTISMEILSEFSKRLDAQERQTAAIATEKVETRIAMYLLKLQEEQGGDTVTLPMMKKDLASLLGTTPETISRKFLEFEEKGWMVSLSQNRIRVLDQASLQML